MTRDRFNLKLAAGAVVAASVVVAFAINTLAAVQRAERLAAQLMNRLDPS